MAATLIPILAAAYCLLRSFDDYHHNRRFWCVLGLAAAVAFLFMPAGPETRTTVIIPAAAN